MVSFNVLFGTLDLSEAADTWEEALETRLNAMQVSKRHGVILTEAPVAAGRVIRVEGRVQAATYEILRGSLDTMQRILNSGKQKLRIADDRYINAYKQSFMHSYVQGSALRAFDFKIDFLADDPFWYANTGDTQTITLTSGDTPVGAFYKESFELINGGEAYVYVKVTVTANQGGNVTRTTVRNTTSGKTMLYIGTIASGKSLIVDSANFTVKNNGVEDLRNWSGYFVILEKCTCTFEVEGSPATYLFEWNERWW
jgi:hypothetical protein